MERLIQYLRKLFFGKFTGHVNISIVNGKVTHVEVTTRKVMEYKELPGKDNAA